MSSLARSIRAAASRLCDPKTMERLVEPILTDIELEHREAIGSGRQWLARWICLSGYVGLFKALVLHGVHTLGRRVMPDEAAIRTLAFAVGAFVVLTVALVLPPLLSVLPHPPPMNLGMFVVYLIPQSLPISIPVGLSFGIACGWSRDATARTMLRRILILGIVGSIAAVATMEWLIPGANQAFREAVVRQVRGDKVYITRGVGERSLSELWRLVEQTSPDRWPNETVSATIGELSISSRETLLHVLHLRLALCLATGTLCLLAVAVADTIRSRNPARAVFGGLVVVYVFSYFGLSTAARVLSPAATGWLPNVSVAAISAFLLGISSIRRRMGSSDVSRA